MTPMLETIYRDVWSEAAYLVEGGGCLLERGGLSRGARRPVWWTEAACLVEPGGLSHGARRPVSWSEAACLVERGDLSHGAR